MQKFQHQFLNVFVQKSGRDYDICREEFFAGKFDTQEAAEKALVELGYLKAEDGNGGWQAKALPRQIRDGWEFVCNERRARVVYQEVYVGPVYSPFPF